MLEIPLQPIENQQLSIVLAGQACKIWIKQKRTGLFLDLMVNNNYILQGQLCLDRVSMCTEVYLGFIGQLSFFDNQGNNDPVYSGLGDRFSLIYLEVGIDV